MQQDYFNLQKSFFMKKAVKEKVSPREITGAFVAVGGVALFFI